MVWGFLGSLAPPFGVEADNPWLRMAPSKQVPVVAATEARRPGASWSQGPFWCPFHGMRPWGGTGLGRPLEQEAFEWQA